MQKQIKQFFTSKAFAVAGASNDRNKVGNKVLRTYLQNNKKVYPINPHEKVIEGLTVIPEINGLPDDVKSISVITPPSVTEKIVEQAVLKQIKNIWMQPGAESMQAIAMCKDHNINVIAGGPCILVELNFNEE